MTLNFPVDRTLKTLWRYLKDRNVDTDLLWDKMEEIAVKTLLSAEDLISGSSYCMPNRYSGYELFGFDIIIDEDLKPWLLEVNISPSLHSSSPLDLAVKGPLIKEVFNIVGFHVPMKLSPEGKVNIFYELPNNTWQSYLIHNLMAIIFVSLSCSKNFFKV